MLVFGGLVMTRRSHFAPALAALALAAPGTALAQDGDPTLRDSFAIGEQGGSLCEVQATVNDRVIEGMFDRAWTIICRDRKSVVSGKSESDRVDRGGRRIIKNKTLIYYLAITST